MVSRCKKSQARGRRLGSEKLCRSSRTAAAPTVSARSFADLRSGLQPFDVPGELRRGSRRDAVRDRYVVERLGEVGQGRGDDCSASPVLSAFQLSASRMRWTALICRWSKLPSMASARLQSIRPSWNRFGTAS